MQVWRVLRLTKAATSHHQLGIIYMSHACINTAFFVDRLILFHLLGPYRAQQKLPTGYEESLDKSPISLTFLLRRFLHAIRGWATSHPSL